MRFTLPQTSTIAWIGTTILVATLGLTGTSYFYLQHQTLQQQQNNAPDPADQLEQVNVATLQNRTLQSQVQQLESELEEAQLELPDQTKTIERTYQLYQSLQDKIKRNQSLAINTQSITDKIADWGKLLLDKEFDQLQTQLTQANTDLDKAYQDKQKEIASRPAHTPAPSSPSSSSSSNPAGYSQRTINTPHGTFSAKVIQLPLAQYQVRTVSGSATTCTNNCTAKPLAQYVAENKAYAGMNGSYFCPPDYGSCTGKTYSYDFALFNSNNGQWINPNARSWDTTGMIFFSGSTATGCRIAEDCSSASGATAAISNFPPLLVYNGQVQSIPNQTAAQTTKNYKGALGVSSTHVYLVTTSGTSLDNLAQVMKSLGVTHALNLDGGGSQALYVNGSYKAGPGRLLPNAVVLVKR